MAVGVAAAAPGGAETAPALRAQAEELRARGASLRASEHGILLEVYAAQSSLDRARAESARLDARASRLAAEEASIRRRAAIVLRSSLAARQRVREALRTLYVDGDVDPVAIILGATSLHEALEGIDGLSRAAQRNARLARDLQASSVRLRRLRVTLAARRRSLDVVRRHVAAATDRLERAAASRLATLADLRQQADLTAEQIQALEARAAVASAASARIAAPPTRPADTAASTTVPSLPPPPLSSTASPVTSGTRSLVVDAVAYHLPGRTASGLPVGVGVIAVDPRVIPLGTKVYVPGYGPAVAADVGSAIIGNVIDLWMPSTVQALTWGRRTVTITIYG